MEFRLDLSKVLGRIFGLSPSSTFSDIAESKGGLARVSVIELEIEAEYGRFFFLPPSNLSFPVSAPCGEDGRKIWRVLLRDLKDMVGRKKTWAGVGSAELGNGAYNSEALVACEPYSSSPRMGNAAYEISYTGLREPTSKAKRGELPKLAFPHLRTNSTQGIVALLTASRSGDPSWDGGGCQLPWTQESGRAVGTATRPGVPGAIGPQERESAAQEQQLKRSGEGFFGESKILCRRGRAIPLRSGRKLELGSANLARNELEFCRDQIASACPCTISPQPDCARSPPSGVRPGSSTAKVSVETHF